MLLAASGLASGLNAVLPALGYGLRTVAQQAARESVRQFAGKSKEQEPGTQWHWMVSQGHKVRGPDSFTCLPHEQYKLLSGPCTVLGLHAQVHLVYATAVACADVSHPMHAIPA